MTDPWGATLAVAARSPAEERALLGRGDGVVSSPLRVADTVVGTLHMRAKAAPSALDAAAAADDDRLRGGARAGARAGLGIRGRRLPARDPRASSLTDREELLARAARALAAGRGRRIDDRRASPPAGADRRGLARPRARGRRARRACRREPLDRRALRARGQPAAEVLVLVPGGEEAAAARAADTVLREMEAGLSGYTFALGRSRVDRGPQRAAARRRARRCWPRTSRRARRRAGWAWRSRRPAPTGCCSRR